MYIFICTPSRNLIFWDSEVFFIPKKARIEEISPAPDMKMTSLQVVQTSVTNRWPTHPNDKIPSVCHRWVQLIFKDRSNYNTFQPTVLSNFRCHRTVPLLNGLKEWLLSCFFKWLFKWLKRIRSRWGTIFLRNERQWRGDGGSCQKTHSEIHPSFWGKHFYLYSSW